MHYKTFNSISIKLLISINSHKFVTIMYSMPKLPYNLITNYSWMTNWNHFWIEKHLLSLCIYCYLTYYLFQILLSVMILSLTVANSWMTNINRLWIEKYFLLLRIHTYFICHLCPQFCYRSWYYLWPLYWILYYFVSLLLNSIY